MAEKKKSEDTGNSEPSEQQEGTDNPALLGEIEQGPSKLEQFLEAHQKKLIALVLALIAAVSSYIIVSGVREGKEVKAGEELISAGDSDDYRNLIKDRPGTQAAGTAQIELARALWDEGQEDTSKETLRDFIAGNAEHPAQPNARMILASYLLEQGEEEEA
ncbi:MAG: hypothetical protein CMP28_04560, partial [Roseibacillus sp.]|nr:hypothetical protein [Roseibacillus sp.]